MMGPHRPDYWDDDDDWSPYWENENDRTWRDEIYNIHWDIEDEEEEDDWSDGI